MSGIAVVTNPRSRRNRRNPHLANRLAYILGEKGQVAAPGDLDALDQAMAHFRDHGVDILAINGGDGTNHVVLTAAVKAWGDRPLPRIALLRGGTMNTVASGLGIHGEPNDLLGRLVERYHSGQPLQTVERNLLMVDDQAGFLFGNGLLSQFLEAYYEFDDPNPFWAAVLLVRTIGSALVGGKLIKRLTRPMRARVTAGNERWERTEWLTVAAGTVDDIGLRFRPFFKAPRYPGYLHAVGLGCSATDVVKQLINVRRAQPMRHPDIFDAVVQDLIIEADEPLGYMIDGDFHKGGKRLHVRVGPRVQLILP